MGLRVQQRDGGAIQEADEAFPASNGWGSAEGAVRTRYVRQRTPLPHRFTRSLDAGLTAIESMVVKVRGEHGGVEKALRLNFVLVVQEF